MKKNSFFRYINDLVGLVYPRLCLCCYEENAIDQDIFCYTCKISLPFTDQFEVATNNFTDKFRGRISLRKGASYLYNYKKSNVQKMLYTLKYRNQPDIGIQVGKRIGKRILEYWKGHTLDTIIPIPLHPRKEHIRGYNQCEKIAEGIHEVTGISIGYKVLKKVLHTDSQTTKNRTERLENVRKSFEGNNTDGLIGKNVLIVDDVVTTGATLEACANICKRAKATSVSMVTVAMAM